MMLVVAGVCAQPLGGAPAGKDTAVKTAAAPADFSGRPSLNDNERRVLLREFIADTLFVHTTFPAGNVGITISPDGKLSPGADEVQALASQFGPAAKPGDRVRITDVKFLRSGVIFEINGGPARKKKWYERLEVSGGGGGIRPADRTNDPDPLNVNARGSFVLVQFKDHVPSITADEMRQRLQLVFDFRAASVSEAYMKSLPPKLAEAVKNHRALVGMDREMVTYAMGRPPRRHREAEGESDYEEWIYGQPPEDVQFVRFVGDVVTRIVTMKVDGERIVRTEDELADIRAELAAQKDEQKKAEEDAAPPRRSAPSLVRPGEVPVSQDPGTRRKDPTPQAPPPQGGSGPGA